MSSTAASFTPNIDNGIVYAINQVGATVFNGGSFTSVTPVGGSSVGRTYILGFDATTGALSGFAPVLNGTVYAIWPGPTSGTVYVGGQFSTVNGVKSKGITLLNASTGAIVSGFKPPALNGIVYSIRPVQRPPVHRGHVHQGRRLDPRTGLASLNPTTGALTSYAQVQLDRPPQLQRQRRQRRGRSEAMDVSPDGTQLIVIGNFKQADGGLDRDQVAMINLSPASASVDPNWNTLEYTAACFNWAFDSYIRDVAVLPGRHLLRDRRRPAAAAPTPTAPARCATPRRAGRPATRGSNVQPTWVDYTGQDTLWSVARDRHRRLRRRPPALAEQHQRLRLRRRRRGAASGHRRARPGQRPAAVLEPGPQPARCRRLRPAAPPPTGLYVGSDTDYIGNYQYQHQKIAFFPLAGGTHRARRRTAEPARHGLSRPASSPTRTPEVLYRVDAGGPAVGAIDDGPDWVADDRQRPVAVPQLTAATAPAGARSAQRGQHGPGEHAVARSSTASAGTRADNARQMHWAFPVPAGTTGRGPALLRQPLHRHQRRRPARVRRRRRRHDRADQLRHRGRASATRPARCGPST